MRSRGTFSDRLQVRGSVVFAQGDTQTGFPFENTITLAHPDLASAEVSAAGYCVLNGTGASAYLERPGVANAGVFAINSVQINLSADAGDIAIVDDEGFLYLVDRAKDLIIVSGVNVYPAEGGEVRLELEGVQQCAVVGVSHPHTGEAVKAFVVVEPGYSLEEDAIIEFAAGLLARYKCPQKVNFVDELPQNQSGKVLKRSLR